MRAHARLATEHTTLAGGRTRTRAATLRSDAPLALRLTHAKEPEPWTARASDVVRVCVAAGAAGPVGGDEFRLDVDVGVHSTLVLAEISPTLLLPGPHGGQSRTWIEIRVGEGATLIWLPEPLIAARNCRHLNDIRVELDPGARLLMREELLLGRHGEQPGAVRQRVRVRRGGRPLYYQDLDVGPGAAGWDGPAVAGSHRAIGSILIVEPDWDDGPPPGRSLSTTAALLPLSGPAVVITALAADNLALRRGLTAGLSVLGTPWDPASDAGAAAQASNEEESDDR